MTGNRNSTDRRGSDQERRDVGNLTGLLERISETEGPINPNDRAVARIFLSAMRNRTGDRSTLVQQR
jgi:hypothetical protein